MAMHPTAREAFRQLGQLGVRVVASAVEGGLEVIHEAIADGAQEVLTRVNRARATARGIGRDRYEGEASATVSDPQPKEQEKR